MDELCRKNYKITVIHNLFTLYVVLRSWIQQTKVENIKLEPHIILPSYVE